MSPVPRLISEVINRQTGTLIQVDFGLNEADHYQATCYGKHDAQGQQVGRSHGFYANADTLKSIQRIAADPLGWCEECQRTHALSVTKEVLDTYSVELVDDEPCGKEWIVYDGQDEDIVGIQADYNTSESYSPFYGMTHRRTGPVRQWDFDFQLGTDTDAELMDSIERRHEQPHFKTIRSAFKWAVMVFEEYKAARARSGIYCPSCGIDVRTDIHGFTLLHWLDCTLSDSNALTKAADVANPLQRGHD
jgi:hypothetical protein